MLKSLKYFKTFPYCLFDTETITAEAGFKEVYFFRTPEDKSELDTNLRLFSTIQLNWTLKVSEIRLIPLENVPAADLEILFGEGRATLTYLLDGNKELFTFPAIMFNAGCGLFGTTTYTSADIVSLGLPSSTSVLKLPAKLIIKGGKTFNFVLRAETSTTLSTNIKIRCCLVGEIERPIITSSTIRSFLF